MSETTTTAPSLTETVSAATPTDTEEFTSYQVHSVLNKVLEIVGLEYRVRPQMMYNYSKNGLISGIKGQKRYDRDQVLRFVEKFVSKRI
jgi:hypothetical protein